MKQFAALTRFRKVSLCVVITSTFLATVMSAQDYTISTHVRHSIPDAVGATTLSLGVLSRIATDAIGNIYFTSSNSVFTVDRAGILKRVAGTGIGAFSGDGRSALSAELNNPTGIAVDQSGNLYVADFGNYRIRKISSNGIITTLIGNGSPGFRGDNGHGG